MKKGPETPTELSVLTVNVKRLDVAVIGVSPLVLNAMSAKAMHELLLPRGRKTTADKAASLKHNPIEEYRDSIYAHREDRETRIYFPGVAFKKAMATAALDLPDLKKAQIGRLVWINEFNVSIYGVPQLFMAVVRSADMKRTPDIRTRAILPRWACRFSVNFVTPLIKEQSIGNLLAAAGLFAGIGDGRQEKGTFSNGQFEMVSDDDERYLDIVNSGGRAEQDAALAEPEMYDLETERLISWFNAELRRRDGAPRTPLKARKAETMLEAAE